MPKRPFPFEDSFTTQQKVFVGLRQINEGVMKSKNMEIVYDKTLKMLYDGSKHDATKIRPFEPLKNSCNMQILKAPIGSRLQKQLEITSEGRLASPSGNQTSVSELNIKATQITCKGCTSLKSEHTQFSNCSYCDSVLCDQCIRVCCKCEKGYCLPCSFSEYKENMEQEICLSCF